MARKIKWTAAKYRIALVGDELPGLRKVVKGFNAGDGYDLRKYSEWSPAMKRRIRTYYDRVHLLEAQERKIVFPRNEKNLRKLQEAFHGDIPSKQFKAAFIPWTAPKVSSGEVVKPKIRYDKSGGITIETSFYRRRFAPFNKRALAADSENEIERVIRSLPRAKTFFVQVGEFQTLNGRDAKTIIPQVMKYMNQYDGKKDLPNGSGNRGDDPRHHHWSKWLSGLIGYEFDDDMNTTEMSRQIVEGIANAKKRRQLQDNRMFSKRNARARVTGWYPADVEPIRKGWYEVLLDVENGVIGREYWEPGIDWLYFWRGLAK